MGIAPAGQPRLRVTVCDERGRPILPRLAQWLCRIAPSNARGVVNIAVVSDDRVRILNSKYRGRDYATDVLSFPTSDPPQMGTSGSAARVESFLGDIVIAEGVARRQARVARHSRDTELRVLALHGLLHLLGYDHEQDNGEMNRVEARLRRRGGLAAGLIERHS